MRTYQQELYASISKRCHSDGIGCDGYQEESFTGLVTCECTCHSEFAPLFATNDDVHEWHIPRHSYRKTTVKNPPSRFRPITDSFGDVWVVLDIFAD